MKKFVVVFMVIAILLTGCSVKMDPQSHEPQTHSHENCDTRNTQTIKCLETMVRVMEKMADRIIELETYHDDQEKSKED